MSLDLTISKKKEEIDLNELYKNIIGNIKITIEKKLGKIDVSELLYEEAIFSYSNLNSYIIYIKDYLEENKNKIIEDHNIIIYKDLITVINSILEIIEDGEDWYVIIYKGEDIYTNRAKIVFYDIIGDFNITHNLTDMADEVKINVKDIFNLSDDCFMTLYQVLWRGDENGFDTLVRTGKFLEKAIPYMKKNKEKLEKYNPKNWWWSYDWLLQKCNEIYDLYLTEKEWEITYSK